MQIAYIGLGKMGANMARRLKDKRYKITVYDANSRTVKAVAKKGIQGADSLDDLMKKVRTSRVIWIMVPWRYVDNVLNGLKPHLNRGDIIIDGGNSPYKLTIKRASKMRRIGVRYLDVGVSGGPSGALNGACMMVGGDKPAYKALEKLFKDLCVPKGYGYMGQSGAGHFVKMVHNGIEYGMMQSIAEGFDIMKRKRLFKLDMEDVSRVYRYGSVIEGRLMDWMHSGFKMYGNDLKQVSGAAHGLGEGAWTVDAAHEMNVPDKVIHEALRARYRSARKPSYQGKIVMTLRNQFGGHSIKND